MHASSMRQGMMALLGSVLLLHATEGAALGLMEAYEAALQNDPVYRAAIHERQAGLEFEEIGKSYLLPNVSANYSVNKNEADVSGKSKFGNTSEERNYQSHVGAIQLRQTLFNLDALARYRQGVAQTQASEAQFSANSQDVMVRVVSVYLSAKYAEDQLALALAQRDALAEQRNMNDRLFKKGDGTITDMIETQARLELAEAQVLEAQDAVTDARAALAAVVGSEVKDLDPLQDRFGVLPMVPARFEEWSVLALAQNPEIVAYRHAAEAAQQEIRKSEAGHAPRLDAVLAVNQTSSDTINTYQQDATIRSIGLQLTLPLYAGGSVRASTRQAEANYGKARANQDSKTNDVLLELQKQFNATQNAFARLEALVKSADSARLLIAATEKSIRGGLRTNLDFLNAQRQLFEVKRDLALARYNYLISYLRLRKAAGTLAIGDLQTIAGYFESRLGRSP